MLVTSGQATGAVSAGAEADGRTIRANRAIADFTLATEAARQLALASPRLGTGLPTETPSLAMYRLLTDEDAEPDTEQGRIRMQIKLIESTAARGECFFEDGREVTDEGTKQKIARIAVDRTVTMFNPKWKAVGAL